MVSTIKVGMDVMRQCCHASLQRAQISQEIGQSGIATADKEAVIHESHQLSRGVVMRRGKGPSGSGAQRLLESPPSLKHRDGSSQHVPDSS